jgi:TPR repeat protein
MWHNQCSHNKYNAATAIGLRQIPQQFQTPPIHWNAMSNLADSSSQAVAAVQLEKFLSSKNAERWCKILAPSYPASGYWLCQEARILQEFNHAHPFAARFIGVDTERRILVTEAPGFTLSQWLNTPQGALDHPFQRSSDLLRLLMAICRIADAIHKKNVVHCGLRPDVICINIDNQRRIDYESIRIIDFGSAHSHQHPLEKPLFLDPQQTRADYLSPSFKQAVNKDWAAYCQLVGEEHKNNWQEFSERARSQYDLTLMPHLAANQLDWHTDMFSIGYWFSQISLRRIDYFTPAHQEQLPKILNRMQKSVWRGGYRSFDNLLQDLHRLELDPQAPVVDCLPQHSSVSYLAAVPTTLANPEFSIGATDTTQTAPAASVAYSQSLEIARESAQRKQRLRLGAAIGGALLLGFAATYLLINQQATPDTEFANPATDSGRIEVQPPLPDAAPTAPAKNATPPESAPQPAQPEKAAEPATQNGTEAPAASDTKDTPAAASSTANADDTLAALRRAAEAGDPAAQTQLGLAYRNGKGVPQDLVEAVKWYNRAAEKNHAEAQAYLGFMYMTGRGVRRNDVEAAKWHRKAAEQGNPLGQYNLGLMYLHGRGGVETSKVQAYLWLKQAAEQNNGSAQVQLATLSQQMSKAEQQEAQKLAASVKPRR